MDIIDVVLAKTLTMGSMDAADKYKLLISAVYSSVEAMEEDFDNPDIPEKALVLIRTDDPEEEDDDKIYLKGEEEWEFVGDLTSIPGPPGESGVIVSEMEPPSELEGVIWVNPLRNTIVSIPLIKDNEVNATDTWSSQKINSLVGNYSSDTWTFIMKDGSTITKKMVTVDD